MAKNSIRDYSATAASNTDIQSVDIDENCAASGINNALREIMADLKDVSTGAVNLETPSADQLNVDNIRIDGNTISSTDTNGHISLSPNGTGGVVVGDTAPQGDDASLFGPVFTVDSGSYDGLIEIAGNRSDGDNTGVAKMQFIQKANNATYKEVAEIAVETDGATANKRGGSLLFKTRADNSTDTPTRMTIDSSGNVGIGTTPSGARLDINTSANEIGTDILCESTSQTSDVFRISASRNTTDNTYYLMRASCNGVADRFQIRDSGNVKNVNNSYGAISDERMKENIVDANSQWDDIKALQLRNYNMIGEDVTQIGVIAQELEAAGMNGLVEEGDFFHATANPDGETRKSVKYSVLYMKAIGALQEAITKIETLETEMTALKARVTALEA